MKHIRKIFCAVALVFITFNFTACNFIKDVAEIVAPTDTWCTMNIPIGNAQVCMNIIYTDEEWVGDSTSKNSWELAEGITIEPGISILITLDDVYSSDDLVGSFFDGLTASTYILKSFPSNGSEFGFGSQATWGALYLAKPELRYGETIQMPSVPVHITYSGQKMGAQDLSDLKNFSWEKFLVDYLSQQLLGM